MPLIALATCHEFAELFFDEAPLVAAIEARGWRPFLTVWNSPDVDWRAYDAVLLRNTWDYAEQPAVFRAWLAYLEQHGITVINPPDILRWNMDKRYLQDLAQDDIPLLPTRFVERGDTVDLAALLADTQWPRAVIKPTISNNGQNTFVSTLASAADDQRRVDALLQHHTLIIQRYAETIAQGEYSLVFFDGEYSHAVRKTPAAGGWLVHEDYGGVNKLIQADTRHIEQAAGVMATVKRRCGMAPAYARVDGVLVDGVFTLMELELIEPELYFTREAQAADRLLDIVARSLP